MKIEFGKAKALTSRKDKTPNKKRCTSLSGLSQSRKVSSGIADPGKKQSKRMNNAHSKAGISFLKSINFSH